MFLKTSSSNSPKGSFWVLETSVMQIERISRVNMKLSKKRSFLFRVKGGGLNDLQQKILRREAKNPELLLFIKYDRTDKI